MAEITLVAGDIFPVLDFVSQPVSSSFATQTFGISQSVVCVPTNNSPRQSLALSQSVSLNKTLNLSLAQYLPTNSVGRRVKERSVSNLLSISGSAYRTLPVSVISQLNLVQELSFVRGCTNTLTINQTVGLNISKVQSISQSLGLGSYTVALIDGNWQFTGLYTPIDILAYDPSKLQIPPVATHKVQLISDTEVLEYDIVDYGDQDRIEHTRISRRTRNEELIIYRDPIWPKTETLKFKLIDLSADQGKRTLDFLSSNLAATIRLTDWIGVRWSGVIVNPDAQLTQNIMDQDCGSGRYEINLEFQGEQLTGYIKELSVSQVLALSQYTSVRTDEANNILVFSHNVDVQTVFNRAANNTFVINQATVRTAFESLNQSLIINQAVVDNEIFNRSNTSTVTFNQSTTNTYERSLTNTITFSQTAVKTVDESISNALTINQSVVDNEIFSRSLTNTITFNQSTANTYNRSLTNTITFNQSTANTYERSLISTLTFSQTATVVQTFNLLLEDGSYLLLEDNTNTLEEL